MKWDIPDIVQIFEIAGAWMHGAWMHGAWMHGAWMHGACLQSEV